MIVRKTTRLTESEMLDYMDTLLEVNLSGTEHEKFSLIVATLRCIGLTNTNRDTISQTCHILKKRNRFFIAHYKQLMHLDGRPAEFTDEDQRRVYRIVEFLQKNGLCKPVTPLPVFDRKGLNLFYFGVQPLPEDNKFSEQPDRVLLKANYTFGDTPQVIQADTRKPVNKVHSKKYTVKKQNKQVYTSGKSNKTVNVQIKKPLADLKQLLESGETVKTQVVKRRIT